MRHLIDKITLIESEVANLPKISKYLEKSRDWLNDEPSIILRVEGEFLLNNKTDNDFAFYNDFAFSIDLYYLFNSNSELYYSVVTYKKDVADISLEREVKPNELSSVREKLLPSIKKELTRLGFSSNAVDKTTVQFNKDNYSSSMQPILRNIDLLHKEVSAAYQWRQENIGDL